MAKLRVVILWHQHQPFYKDLVTGQYRLPWTRLHALKDYYGMVKLLDEFPEVHQTFNLVPSLVNQIQDYASGNAQDPFLQVASKLASDLSQQERKFALQYLFQANLINVIGRYPRYKELLEKFQSAGDSPERAEKIFSTQDLTDLQVLSQIGWFDEFFLAEKEVVELIRKGRNFSLEDQSFVIAQQRIYLGRVLPVHADAAKRGLIELSTSPFYHPILPLICDSQQGAVSTPGLPLPQNRYRHPEDAREQLKRGLDLHEKVFGLRPRGVWPSEGSVSEETISVAHNLGVQWMATDEGVLGRSLGSNFSRDGSGRLSANLAHQLYTTYRYEKEGTRMNLVFRDHTLSDLIGFVYSGMPPQDAANNLIHKIRDSAQPMIAEGRDAVVPIILDGENAWEYYPQSGREFLRRFYDALQSSSDMEAVTVTEAIERHKPAASLRSLVPGSWIHANFNVWIGAPEDNKAWDYLYHARTFYEQAAPGATESQRRLAYEELLIAEGSDWNWWYGPEHHSANDRDFDELYRKHLSNVYQALGGVPPDYLAQPIAGGGSRPSYTPQSAYIHPRIAGDMVRYFEWMGAARYTADARSGAMHGKQFLIDEVFAGIDEEFVYGRLDFASGIPEGPFEIVVNLEAKTSGGGDPDIKLRLGASVIDKKITAWQVAEDNNVLLNASGSSRVVLDRNFEFRLPISWLRHGPTPTSEPRPDFRENGAERIRIRFSLWQQRLPVDALPSEGWIELELVAEEDLEAISG